MKKTDIVQQSDARKPAEVFHVCTYIAEECTARGWSRAELIVRMGGETKRERLLDQGAMDFLYAQMEDPSNFEGLRLGRDMAEKLGRAFGVSPEFFLNLEKAWLAGQSGGAA